MEFKDKSSGSKQVLFDVATATTVPKKVLPESEQEENESRRLWSKLTEAIKGESAERDWKSGGCRRAGEGG